MTLALILLLSLSQGSQAPAPQQQPPAPASANGDTDGVATLLKVRRICVEPFGDDPLSRQAEAMLINALSESKRFTITEKCERADAILKGVSTEETHQEARSFSEGTAAGNAAVRESSHSTETINDAHLAVRLVDRESGDVLWSTTQESSGAKYKSARADAAEKIVQKLLWDLQKLQKQEQERSAGADKKPG